MRERRNTIFTSAQLSTFFKELERHVRGFQPPMSVLLSKQFGRDPFILLISCLMSLRCRDVVTYGVALKLFKRAQTPRELLSIPVNELQKLFYPLGFYKKKTETVRAVSQELLDRFGGHVPKTEGELLSLPGVGRKTANLVLSEAYGIPAICVDTHVHRLANELGLVDTKTPEATEFALQKLFPRSQWIKLHQYLVTCGQNKCDLTSLKKILADS